MSDEEQLEYAKFQLSGFMSLFGRKTDYYGYEGCSCFMDNGNGEYIILVDMNEDRVLLKDSIYIEKGSSSKDRMMAQLRTHKYTDNDSVDVEYIRLKRTDEQGKKHNLYVGYVPIAYDGEIKAVITLNYNYDLFVKKIDNMLIAALAVIIAVNLLVCVLFIYRTRKIATKPIESIQGAVREYMTTRNSDSARNKLNAIDSNNEIALLARDVDEMIADTDDYVSEIEQAGIELRTLTKDVMEALASAIDAKDKYTNGHSKRVAEYSRKIAEISGKSPEECEMIYNAGLLHDVGKIGVPLEILQKTSRLTDEEFEQIKRHPVTGGDILSQIHGSPWLKTGALYHHERYNGRGYPEGLKGEEIPEISRIIAVADAYDAMTSNRSYRNAIPQHIVREELVKGSGIQFDPDFARIMIHLIDLDIEYSMQESISGENLDKNASMRCDSIYHDCSEGVNITRDMAKIRFCCQPDDGLAADKCLPTLIIFDSLDGQVHPGEEKNKDILYYEFAKIRLDGQVTPLGVRKSEVRVTDGQTDIERAYFGEPVHGQRYKIETVRNRDHLLVHVSTETQMFDVILALPDPARYTYISIGGENCEIHNLRVDTGAPDTSDIVIPRIAEEISYTRGCPAGDIPNIEVDGPRFVSSEGIPICGDMTLSFHTMSYPAARLVWHCPYFCIFTSSNGQIGGDNYREYLLLKLDGESWESAVNVDNQVTVEQTKSFEGWNQWMEQNKQGLDCVVDIRREGSRIIMRTENAGVAITSTTTVLDGTEDIYLAITGDQCAVTDIKFKKE